MNVHYRLVFFLALLVLLANTMQISSSEERELRPIYLLMKIIAQDKSQQVDPAWQERMLALNGAYPRCEAPIVFSLSSCKARETFSRRCSC